MGLQEQSFEVRFNDGGDESDENLIGSEGVASVVDFEYRKDGGLRKRHGWGRLGTLEAGMDAQSLVSNGTALGVLCRNALVGTSAAALDVEASPRLRNGARFGVRRLGILNDAADFIDCDVAWCADGRICVASTLYDGSAYRVRVALFDAAGNCRYVNTTTDAANPRVVPRSTGTFDIYYRKVSNHTISVTHLAGDPSAGGTVTSTSGLVTLHATYYAFDVTVGPLGAFAYLVYNDGSSHLTVAKIATGSTVSVSYDTGITTADYPSIDYVSAAGNLAIVYATKGGNGASQIAVNTTPDTTTVGPTVIDAAAHVIVRTAVVEVLSDAHAGTYALLQVQGAGFGLTQATRDAYLKSDHTGLSNTDFHQTIFTTRPLTLTSSAFDSARDAGRPFAGFMPAYGGVNRDPTIPTLLLGMCKVSGTNDFESATAPAFTSLRYYPAAALLTDQAARPFDEPASVPDGVPACSIADDGNGTWYVAGLYIVDEADGTKHTNVALLAVDVAPAREPQVVLGRTTYLGGGILRAWDGLDFGEVTAAWPPFQPQATTVGSGGSPAAGDYSYVCTAEYVDAQGELHRSPVSEAESLTGHTGGSVSVAVRLHVPTAWGDASAVRPWLVKLYRTANGGATYNLTAQATVTTSADPSVTLTDSNSDTTIADHEFLYTTGNLLEAQLPPAAAALAVHRNRLWLIDAVDPRNIWPSKLKAEAIAPEFNHALAQRIEQGSLPVALASLDDKLLIGTGSEILAIVGDGPDDTGVASGSAAWAPAEIVAPGVGVSGPHAMLTTPLGVILHGPSGFKLLGRDLGTADIGGKLADTAPGSATVLRSINFPTLQQAWFLLADAAGTKIIAFNYARGQLRWSRYTCQATDGTHAAIALDLADFAGAPALLATINGAAYVYVMDAAAWDDDGTFVPAEMETGWMRPAQLLGEARFRVVHAFGESDGDSGLTLIPTVQGGEPKAAESYTWDGDELTALDPSHPRVRVRQQRGVALSVLLRQVDGGTADSEGFTPFGLFVEYGTHGRGGRTPKTGAPG